MDLDSSRASSALRPPWPATSATSPFILSVLNLASLFVIWTASLSLSRACSAHNRRYQSSEFGKWEVAIFGRNNNDPKEVLSFDIPPFSIPFTAAPETVLSAFLSVSLATPTGPLFSRAVEDIDLAAVTDKAGEILAVACTVLTRARNDIFSEIQLSYRQKNISPLKDKMN